MVRVITWVNAGCRITRVFFDFAGTLVEGVPNWEFPQVQACAECGLDVSPSDVKAAIWRIWGPLEGCAHPDASTDELTYSAWIGAIEGAILQELGLSDDKTRSATRRVMELQIATASYRIYPDVLPTLEALRQRGVQLGIVSNFAWRLPELVSDLGLAGYFDQIITSARAGYRKPQREIFEHALDLAVAVPTESVFVGDDLVCDVGGARAAGIGAILIDRSRPRSVRHGRIRTLPELPNLLATLQMPTSGANVG